MNKMKELIQKLENIAFKNDEEFEYNMNIRFSVGQLFYEIVVTEAAEGHEFLTAGGDTIENAVANAFLEIPSCCESWGYEDVE